jgi:MFS family permease
MPDYMSRAFDKAIADRYEWVLSINPFIILFGTPLLAALTRRVHVVTMMIAGTLVSAAATFFLVPGPSFSALIAYEVVFSIGEALWSSRFLEYVADVAPPDKVGLYMGVAQIPWFLAKTTTGLYSGFLLERFCPPLGQGPQATGTLWLIYGVAGMVTPLGLLAARRWLQAGRLDDHVARPASG